MSTSTTCRLPSDLSLEVFTNQGAMSCIAEHLPAAAQAALARTRKAIHQIMTGKVIGQAPTPSATATGPEINTGIITTLMREQMAADGHRTTAPEYLQWQGARAVLDPSTSPPVYPPIKNLDLTHTDVNDEECAQILQHCSPTALNLSKCYDLTHDGLVRIFSNKESFCNLERLDLSGTHLDDALLGQIFSVCPRLKSLNLKYCRGLTNEGLSRIFSNAEWVQNLEHLDVGHTSAFSNDALWGIIAKNCPNLKSLNCVYAGFTYQGLTRVFSTPCKWEHLAIGSEQFAFDQPLLKPMFENCPNLKSLEIFAINAHLLTHDNLVDIFSSFQSPKKLESLKINFPDSLSLEDDAFLRLVLRNFPGLKRLRLYSRTSHFTTDGVRDIFSSYDSLPNLEKLSLPHLEIDDGLFELIIKKCPHLTSLGFSWKDHLTYEGLSRIFSSFESLRKLEHFRLPSQLSMDDARLDALLEIISKNCPKLQSIDICPTFKDTRSFPWLWSVLSQQPTDSRLGLLTRRFPQVVVNSSCREDGQPYFVSRRHPPPQQPPQPSLFSRIISKFW